MATTVRSHAKINLGLGIGAPRADGFHGLVTVYQTLEVHDFVTVSARVAGETSIRLTSNDRRVPTDGRNTAWMMVELALSALGVCAEVSIHIEKRLPVQGGLGAGSANAVAALVGLEVELGIVELGIDSFGRSAGSHLSRNPPIDEDLSMGAPKNKGVAKEGHQDFFELGEPRSQSRDRGHPHLCSLELGHPDFFDFSLRSWGAERLRIAELVGSDVPLFLVGGAVLGVDRGQAVFPLPDLEPTWCVVAVPAVGVSTPRAFRDWDALCLAEGLTDASSAAKLSELSRAYAASFAGVEVWDGSSGVSFPCGGDLAGPQVSALVRTGIVNDFERVVFQQHPLLSEIKCVLAASGSPEEASYASLSGSGSALFGLYRAQGEAEAACERLRAMGVESLLTRTLPRAAYWRQMLS